MPFQKMVFARQYFRVFLSFLVTVFLTRIYEYFFVASKLFIDQAYRFEAYGLLYDAWMVFIYGFIIFFPFLLLYFLNKRIAFVFFHLINLVVLICYIGLILTFSERNTPFDHEFFTRKTAESLTTVKQMMSGSLKVFVPFVLYIGLYFLLYYKAFKNLAVNTKIIFVSAFLFLAAVLFAGYSNPSPGNFQKIGGYYLTSNKLTYWIQDSYHYLTSKAKNHPLNNKELEKQISFYQQNQPFQFTNKEYPLLHKNDNKDVLGSFFNLKTTPPNIVILVVEGLSRDFSGDRAYAGSFTPFLDSLSLHSLVWDNFLSTAPGTFAAHPAISGSLPYGKRGFSIMNVMPEHLSLIKILKANGYYTSFMIGFNPDFDNMGGYIRLQGTDFILSQYPSKYKEMGVGEEGWSMGYPDDALFSRSFEVMDSVKKMPYLNIYHTATSHMPYLFQQKPSYEKLFDQKLKTMSVAKDIKRTLRETKGVLVTFMFADDCINKFFSDYAKRPEYGNTIFFITGDHHIGSFPSTGEIDDYHVPFIVYSPMLKKSQKFYSVNSHNNIAPTITNFVLHNFNLPYKPAEVHWLGDVIDTATAFRNIHSMAFMSWSREINDYIWKNYFISDDQLYKLTPDLLQVPYKNDSIKNIITALRENFKIINNYVCDSNKVFPAEQPILPDHKELIFSYNDPGAKLIFAKLPDTSLMPDFKVPHNFKYLYVEASAKVNMPGQYIDNHPTLRFALIDTKNNNRHYLYYSKRDIVTLSKTDFIPRQWNSISVNDLFTLDDYRNITDLKFEAAIYTDSIPINLKLQDFKVRVYGIKKR
ncbi:MAG: Sulfatase [Chitinophagaceae bacterium]|nr:Sulfatase [Chitinophagaceae bacterium]